MKTLLSLILGTLLIFLSLNFNKISRKNLTEQEKSGLLYMFEEEKLAKDTYTILYEKWQTRQFENIKESETVHVQKVQELLDENKISYEILPQGKFNNEKLQKLYNQLIEKGNLSEIDALKVGATIEDVDIFDLENFIKKTDNQNIKTVYEFLNCGSRNHLRAFNRGLQMRDENYKPQFIKQENFEKTLNSDHERCGRMN